MNKQCRKLMLVTEDDSREIISSVSGQALTRFTIEAWTDGRHSVLFCQGLVIDVRCDIDGFNPMTLRI